MLQKKPNQKSIKGILQKLPLQLHFGTGRLGGSESSTRRNCPVWQSPRGSTVWRGPFGRWSSRNQPGENYIRYFKVEREQTVERRVRRTQDRIVSMGRLATWKLLLKLGAGQMSWVKGDLLRSPLRLNVSRVTQVFLSISWSGQVSAG